MSFILLLPVVLPMLAGAGVVFLPFRNRKARNLWILATVTGCSLVNAGLMLSRPAAAFTLAELTPEISIAFRMDGLSIIFLALVSFLWPLASLYSFEYMEKEEHQARFFGCYTACYGITAGVAMSANMITLYLFVELLTLITVPLVAHEGDRRSMRAARIYMVYSIGGAALSLIGIMLLIHRTGRADFVFGGAAAGGNGDGLLTAAWMLTFLGFGVKAAILPFHAWLPTAGVAPTPVTALLHAVAVVKSGVFAVIRSTFFAFGPAMLAGTWGQKAALIVTAATILYGSVTAFREQHIKRRLAYSTVSNLSYILFGAMLMTTAGLTAAMSHFLFHGVMKITLFFWAGAVIHRTGREYAIRLNGLAHRMPWTFAAYTVGALAMTGVPLLPGFVSKMNLIRAAVDSGCGIYAYIGIAVLLCSALLMAGYLILPSVRAWIPRSEPQPVFTERDRDPGWRMLTVLAVLCIAMLALGCCSVPVMNTLEALIAGGTGGGMI